MDTTFLKSNRFWALIVGAAVLYLQTKGWIGDAEATLVGTIIAGFIAVRTIDRVGEKIGGE